MGQGKDKKYALYSVSDEKEKVALFKRSVQIPASKRTVESYETGVQVRHCQKLPQALKCVETSTITFARSAADQ